MSKLQINLVIFFSIAAMLGGVIAYGFKLGKDSCERGVLIKTVTVSEKRNNIANNRPSDSTVFFSELLNPSIEW